MEQRTTRDAESLDKWRKEAIRLHQKEIDDKNKESKSVRKARFFSYSKTPKRFFRKKHFGRQTSIVFTSADIQQRITGTHPDLNVPCAGIRRMLTRMHQSLYITEKYAEP